MSVLTCALVLAAEPTASPQSTPPPSHLDRWLAAVDGHLPGHADDAVRDVGRWSREDLRDRVLAKLRPSADRSRRAAVLKRGAMLHSDIAMIRVLAGEFFAVTRPDGQPQASYQMHLDMARRLLERVVPEPEHDEDVRAWYDALTAWLFNRYLLGDLSEHLERARNVLREDAGLLFDTGVFNETLAAPIVQNTAVTGRSRSGTTSRAFAAASFGLASPVTHHRRAERAFERALELDPGLTEARLRLGHVLGELGRHDDAHEQLTAVMKATGDPFLLYHAHLFLGRVHEAAGDADRAVQSYETSLLSFPRAQSPLLAIGRIAAARGDAAGADAATARVLSLPWNERERVDPWWQYHEGPGRHALVSIDRLRARIAALPRLTPHQASMAARTAAVAR